MPLHNFHCRQSPSFIFLSRWEEVIYFDLPSPFSTTIVYENWNWKPTIEEIHSILLCLISLNCFRFYYVYFRWMLGWWIFYNYTVGLFIFCSLIHRWMICNYTVPLFIFCSMIFAFGSTIFNFIDESIAIIQLDVYISFNDSVMNVL